MVEKWGVGTDCCLRRIIFIEYLRIAFVFFMLCFERSS